MLLGVTALVVGPLAHSLGLRHSKAALPLKAPLPTFDESRIHPYRVVKRHILEAPVLEALETRDYLSWTLEDTSKSPPNPLKYANLFVTYYTGGSHLVPHTPDVCYLGAGYQPAQPHESMELGIGSSSVLGEKLPVRVCTFAKTSIFQRQEVSVVYTFHSNGQFAASRSKVRLLVNDLSNTYAYFSKVEVSFAGASRRQAVEGARKLLARVLPVLVEHHWPDFEKAERRARSGSDPPPPAQDTNRDS